MTEENSVVISQSEEDNILIVQQENRTDIRLVSSGAQGIPGIPGSDGEDGSPGKSAYELAAENGFSGTVSDWLLSLKGEPGVDGSDGESGRGIDSITRTSGNGAPGTTDTYTISYTDETTSTFSVYNGADGADGEDGGTGGGSGLTPEQLEKFSDLNVYASDSYLYEGQTGEIVDSHSLGDVIISTNPDTLGLFTVVPQPFNPGATGIAGYFNISGQSDPNATWYLISSTDASLLEATNENLSSEGFSPNGTVDGVPDWDASWTGTKFWNEGLTWPAARGTTDILGAPQVFTKIRHPDQIDSSEFIEWNSYTGNMNFQVRYEQDSGTWLSASAGVLMYVPDMSPLTGVVAPGRFVYPLVNAISTENSWSVGSFDGSTFKSSTLDMKQQIETAFGVEVEVDPYVYFVLMSNSGPASYSAPSPAAIEGSLTYHHLDLGGSSGPSLPTGGTVGQTLIKNSDTDGDASWQNFPPGIWVGTEPPSDTTKYPVWVDTSA